MQDRPRSSGARVDLWGRPWGWLFVLLGGAAALRIVALSDAPRPNAHVVGAAWAIVHGGPHGEGGFAYLLAPLQRLCSEPSYETARGLVLALGVLGVAAAWWLGRAAYGTAAAFVAGAAVAVDTAHVFASREVVAAVPLAALCAIALALLAAGRIEWAGAVAGLAAAVDFPGWLLVVPILAVAWGVWRRVGIAVALTAVLSAPAWFTLGDRFGAGGPSWPRLLWDGLGPVLAIAAAGFIGAVAMRSRADIALASFVAAYGVYLLAATDHRARYTLPLVPALGALAGRFRALAPVALLLLVLPMTWSIRDARDLQKASTMGRGETAGSPHRARAGGVVAGRLRLLERRDEGRRRGRAETGL
ncbi:MAG TPA: hypothetical protein VGJ77_06115 [Gaiellaceae bacterium]